MSSESGLSGCFPPGPTIPKIPVRSFFSTNAWTIAVMLDSVLEYTPLEIHEFTKMLVQSSQDEIIMSIL